MSGDVGLHEQPIVFYHEEMTEAKKIILRHKEIKLAYLEINNQKENVWKHPRLWYKWNSFSIFAQ